MYMYIYVVHMYIYLAYMWCISYRKDHRTMETSVVGDAEARRERDGSERCSEENDRDPLARRTGSRSAVSRKRIEMRWEKRTMR